METGRRRVELIAQDGADLAGVGSPATLRSFTSLVLPGGETGPIFTATVRPKESNSVQGLYAIDSLGNLQELVRANQTFEGRMVRRFGALRTAHGSETPSHFSNAAGQVVAHLNFADGGEAIALFEVP